MTCITFIGLDPGCSPATLLWSGGYHTHVLSGVPTVVTGWGINPLEEGCLQSRFTIYKLLNLVTEKHANKY